MTDSVIGYSILLGLLGIVSIALIVQCNRADELAKTVKKHQRIVTVCNETALKLQHIIAMQQESIKQLSEANQYRNITVAEYQARFANPDTTLRNTVDTLGTGVVESGTEQQTA